MKQGSKQVVKQEVVVETSGDEIKRAFELFDENGNGKIDAREIRNAMKRVQDVYMNAGYLPSLTDWEDMSYEDKKEFLM